MGIIVSVIQFSVDLDTLLLVSGGGTFLQPLIELLGQVVELAGRTIVDAVFDAHSAGRALLLEVVEIVVTAVIRHSQVVLLRDQTVTGQAIVAISEFMSRYPDSEKYGQFEQMRNELTGRLHDKEFLNAYTYYKIGKHKSAIVALKNALRKYPETPHREELMYLIVGSGYELAHNSVQRKQTDRYLSMLDSYYTFIAEFPESTHRKEVDRMAKEAKDYLAKNQKNDTQDGN